MGDTPDVTPAAAIVPAPAAAKTTAIERVPVRVGLAPTSIEEAWRTAQYVAQSTLVPLPYRDKPNDALIAIMLGAELGLSAINALQSIAVINGRPSIYGDGLLALIRQSPLCTGHDEYFTVDGVERIDMITGDLLALDSTTAVCVFHRRGDDLPIVRTFSIAQAKRAHLWNKAGPWQEYPDRMLRMRARTFAARDAFPDLLRGLSTAEEVADLPLETPAAPPRVRRLSEPVEAAPEVIPAPRAEEHADGAC